MQLNMFSTMPKWQPPQDFPMLRGNVALDFECRDPYLNKIGSGSPWARLDGGRARDERFGYPVGVALAVEDQKFYYPVAHQGGGNLPAGNVYSWLKHICESPDVTLIMAHAPYDLSWLMALGIKPANPPHDIQLMAPLIDEHRFSYGLDSLMKDYLGTRKDEAGLKQALKDHQLAGKRDLWKLPAGHVATYAEADAEGTLQVFNKLWPMLIEQELMEAYEVERQLQPFITDMRFRGIRVDIPHAERVQQKAFRKEKEAAEEFKRVTGKKFGAFDDSLGQAFVDLGVEVDRTRTGKLSVTAGFLNRCAHPLAKVLRDWRRWVKCRTTFIEGYVLEHSINGRVHAHFHQLRAEGEDGSQHGTITHRFSSSNPNLQNLVNPEKDPEIGYDVRACMLPEDGEQWGSIDYKSQEPRLITHFAAMYEQYHVDRGIRSEINGALQVAARWREDPNMDPYAPITETAQIKRKAAKTIYLARAYGAGEGKICDELGLPTVMKSFIKRVGGVEQEIEYRGAGEEGEAILKAFNDAAPYVAQMKNVCQRLAETRGYVKGLDGARFRAAGEHEFHKMLNKLAQGSAGRQNKRGMLAVCQAGLSRQLLATVHDEIGVSIANPDMQKTLISCMVDAVQLFVPSAVDVQLGRNWGEASVPL